MKQIMQTFSEGESQALSNSRVMQVLLIFFKKTLDKQSSQVSPEFKVKVNNDSCLQRVCSRLIVRPRCIHV